MPSPHKPSGPNAFEASCAADRTPESAADVSGPDVSTDIEFGEVIEHYSQEKTPDRIKVCPHCGAGMADLLTVCTQCRGKLDHQTDIEITEVQGVEKAIKGGGLSLAAVLGVVTLAALGCGAFLAHHLLGALYLTLVAPSVLTTWIHLENLRRANQRTSWLDMAATFGWHTVMAFGILLSAAVGLFLLFGLVSWIARLVIFP